MHLNKLTHINVILDKNSTSFCHYVNKAYFQKGSRLISIERLKQIIQHVKDLNVHVNFLFGNNRLPLEYEKAIESISHIKILPIKLMGIYQEGLWVINQDDFSFIDKMDSDNSRYLILCLKKEDLKKLSGIVNGLSGKYTKLIVAILNIDSYSEFDLNAYEEQLEKVKDTLAASYKNGDSMEINIISDRLLLNQMYNCNAGIDHVTFAPNGKFYLCPGFYYDDKKNSIGTIKNGLEIKNAELLELNHAPICSLCDAYQCKRCFYLNKKITLDINIPSHEQCVISHLERNISRKLLGELKPSIKSFKQFNNIPYIPYLDPFEILKDNMTIEDLKSFRIKNKLKPLEPLSFDRININAPKKKDLVDNKMNERDMLEKIYETQTEILKILKYMRGV